MSLEKAQFEINQGIANVTAALGDGSGPAPFFRVPGLLRADGVERYAASQNLQVWSTDFLADDWTRIGSAQVYSRALQRIEAAHKGILLLHDIQPRTVEALPHLLRELKKRGYKIVQAVPASADRPKTVTDPGQWALHSRQMSKTPIFLETDPELPAPHPASFGFDVGSNSISFFQKISLAPDPAWQPLTLSEPSRLTPVSTWPTGFEVTRDTPNLSDQFHLPAASSRSVDIVGEAGGLVAVNEIQRLLETLPEDAVPADDRSGRSNRTSGQVATLRPRGGPAANTVMPRGAFP
jgi:hypothetical protein